MRYSASGTSVSQLVGKAVKAQLAASPLCDSSSAREAGSRSENSVWGTLPTRPSDARFRASHEVLRSHCARMFALASTLRPARRRECLGACQAPPLHREVCGQVLQSRPAVGHAAPAMCPPKTPNRRRNVAFQRTRAPALLVEGGVGLSVPAAPPPPASRVARQLWTAASCWAAKSAVSAGARVRSKQMQRGAAQ